MRNLKVFFLSGTIVLGVILLIISFQNFAATCNFINFFFFPIDSTVSPTILFFIVAFLGIITGMFIMGLLMSLISKDDDDIEPSKF